MSRKSDIYGHAGGVGIEGLFSMYPMSKRPRATPVSQASQSDMSHNQIVRSNKGLVSSTEYGENRRALTYKARLHAAKYLTCDSLLKDLFFPLQTYAKNFGFCSTTGIGGMPAAQAEEGYNPSNDSTFAKSNGVYRGLALFSCRTDVLHDTDEFKLNPISQECGKSTINGTEQSMYSAYRRFNNGPPIPAGSNVNTGAQVASTSPSGQQAQEVVLTSVPDNTRKFNKDYIQLSEVGALNEIEEASLAASNFASSITLDAHKRGTTTTKTRNDLTDVPQWDGTGLMTYTSDSIKSYYPNFRDTTVRIADGCMELDITNGKNSSCLIEVVVLSQKKLNYDWTPQEYFNEVWQAVDYQQNQNRPNYVPTNTDDVSAPGGWQAFYDPEYPLLSVKSSCAKKVNSMVNEVHRSSHMLAPGQSKIVKIALGSLFYNIGNKSDDGWPATRDTTFARQQLPFCPYQAGSLLFAIGHSGVDQLSMPTPNTSIANGNTFWMKPDTNDNAGEGNYHSVHGSGFWAGKVKAPSEIVVKGRYTEKFYPTYCIAKDRSYFDDSIMLPPHVMSGSNSVLLSSGLPVQETVGTVDATHQAVAAKVSSAQKIG